jgi:hypothetical protein
VQLHKVEIKSQGETNSWRTDPTAGPELANCKGRAGAQFERGKGGWSWSVCSGEKVADGEGKMMNHELGDAKPVEVWR